MMMFETSKRVPKTKKRCCVFKIFYNTCAIKTLWKINCDNHSLLSLLYPDSYKRIRKTKAPSKTSSFPIAQNYLAMDISGWQKQNTFVVNKWAIISRKTFSPILVSREAYLTGFALLIVAGTLFFLASSNVFSCFLLPATISWSKSWYILKVLPRRWEPITNSGDYRNSRALIGRIIYQAAKRRGKYLPLSPTLRSIIVLVYTIQAE